MRSIKQWYFHKVSQQLSELNGIQATPIPEYWEKPGGGGYVASIIFRPTPDASKDRVTDRNEDEFFEDWCRSGGALTLPRSFRTLAQLNVVIDDRTYVGYGLIKGAWILHRARKIAADRERAFENEMRRRHRFFSDLLVPAERIQLVELILKEFCEYGPVEFTVDDLLSKLHAPEWKDFNGSFEVEQKHQFILKGLVDDGILEAGDKFKPLPKILRVYEEDQRERLRWEERKDVDQRMMNIQTTVKIATIVIALGTVAGAAANVWAARDKPVPELQENNPPPTGQQQCYEDPPSSARAGTCEDGLCVAVLFSTVLKSPT